MSAKRRRIHKTLVWLERVNKILRRHPWKFACKMSIDLTDEALNYIYSKPNEGGKSNE